MRLKSGILLSVLAGVLCVSGCDSGSASYKPEVAANQYGAITLEALSTVGIEGAGVVVIAHLDSYQGPLTITFTTDNDNIILDASYCAIDRSDGCSVVAYGQKLGVSTITATSSLYGYTPCAITLTVESST